MSKLLRAFVALLYGFRMCFGDAALRRLAAWPWFIGALCYLASLIGSYYAHASVVAWLVPEPSGFWQQTLYVLAWIAGALFLLMISMILSLIFVLIFSGINQSAIAERILADRGLLVVAHGGAVKDVVKEASRSVCTEIVKLLWLLPLGLLCVVIGLVPILSPFALLLAAWLLAYEFVDIALDVLRLSVRARLRFALQKAPLLIAFGLTLSVCWAVPFLGIALAPVAAAAAAWLIAEVGIPQSSSLKGGEK